jgi:hypothetical protein
MHKSFATPLLINRIYFLVSTLKNQQNRGKFHAHMDTQNIKSPHMRKHQIPRLGRSNKSTCCPKQIILVYLKMFPQASQFKWEIQTSLPCLIHAFTLKMSLNLKKTRINHSVSHIVRQL